MANNAIKMITKLILSSLILIAYHVSAGTNQLETMSDWELSDVSGQALMSLSYISPNDSANKMSGKGVGFYKLGMEAEVDINANIAKLQLGCGGVNGADGCDIDIDNLSLSGISDTRDGRASSSAKLTNPFIQFAIKNPNSASTREVVGINLSSEKAEGLLTFGTENSKVKNGINSLSGYMKVAATTGTALVNGYGQSKISGENARTQLRQSDGFNAISGKACCVFLFGNFNFSTTGYDLNLLDKASGSNILKGDLVMKEQEISGKRINSAPLTATANVRDIDLSGNISAQVAGLINLNNKNTKGTIQNLKVDVLINEGLGYFHKANLNGTPVSLSLQSQDIQWTGNNSTSQRGWWLEMSNPIEIGKIDPSEKVDIPQSTLNEVMSQVGNSLNAKPIPCGAIFALNCLAGLDIPVGNINLSAAPPAKMTLNDLQLVQQSFQPNCYGNLKFC